jgi:hypothetical protein
MFRVRWLLAALIFGSMAAVAGLQATVAQDATPIPVPTPTSAGCDQMPAYTEARRTIQDEMFSGIEAVFPEVGTPIIEHGDELLNAMFVMTPEQEMQLSELYDSTADKIEKLDEPEIATFYDDQVVALYRVSASAFEEAAKTDLSAAGVKYGNTLTALGEAINTYGTAATAVCPAFGDVLKIDQTQVGI